MNLATFHEAYGPIDAAAPYLELFVTPDESPTGEWGFFCNHCGRAVEGVPCPDHAPMAFPGLRLAECDAEPRHILFGHDAQDYGLPCYRCLYQEQIAKERAKHACRHWGWRRWRVTRWVVHYLPITGYGYNHGINGCDGCLVTPAVSWEWTR